MPGTELGHDMHGIDIYSMSECITKDFMAVLNEAGIFNCAVASCKCNLKANVQFCFLEIAFCTENSGKILSRNVLLLLLLFLLILT